MMFDMLITAVVVALYAFSAVLLLGSLKKAAPALANNIEDTSSHPQDQNQSNTPAAQHKKAIVIATIAFGLHAFVTVLQAGFPDALNLPFFTALSAMGATVVAIQLLLCLRWPAGYLGVAVYPIAALTILASTLIGNSSTSTLATNVQLHVLFSITAYAVLALAALQALLVSVQRHYLNQHRPGGFIRQLPPLTKTETLLFVLLGSGFVLLSLALGSGFVSLDNMFAQNVAHKTILSCLAWVIFAVLLFGRWRFGWRGQRAVRWTLGGFAVLAIAYFGSKLVLELILERT